MKQEKDNLEDLFKERFEDFEPEVRPDVWKNIQAGLKGVGIGVLIKGLLNKVGSNAIVAVVSSAAAVMGTVAVMNYNKEVPAGQNKPATRVVVQKPVPAKPEEIKEFLSDKPVEKQQVAELPGKQEEKKKPVVSAGNKKQLEEALKELSEQTIASISSSAVGGSVPLIVNFSNEGRGKINRWDFGDGKRDNGVNPIHVYDVPGIYTVVLNSTSADGYTSSDTMTVEVTGNSSFSATANTFSPNGDNQNDTFFFTSKNMQEMSTVIYDVKGNVIYSQQGIDFRWDGNMSGGKPAREGDYIFIMNGLGLDGKKYEKKGKIRLTR